MDKRRSILNVSVSILSRILLLAMTGIARTCEGRLTEIVVNGALSLVLSALALGLTAAADRGFRNEMRALIGIARSWLLRLKRA